jgi:hypothetical protein
MDPEGALLRQFTPLISAELERIGCKQTVSDPSAPTGSVPAFGFGMDRPFTRESLAGLVAELRTVPSGAGWRGLFAHFGFDQSDLGDSDALPTT